MIKWWCGWVKKMVKGEDRNRNAENKWTLKWSLFGWQKESAQWFSKIILHSRHHQINVHPEGKLMIDLRIDMVYMIG